MDDFVSGSLQAASPQGILGSIVAGIIQVLPLILVPLLLKGILDSVPVLGKAAQNLMNRSTKAASNYGNKDTGFFGRRRAEYMNNQRNAFGRKLTDAERRDPKRRTLGNRYQSYSHAREEQLGAIKTQGAEETKARIADGDTSYSTRIARAAHHQSEDAGILGADTSQRMKQDLKERVVNDDHLRALDQRTRASMLGERTAENQAQQKFTTALRASGMTDQLDENGNPVLDDSGAPIRVPVDSSLLDVAAGRVQGARQEGILRAQAAAVSAGFDVDDAGIKNQTALLTQQLTDIQKRGPVRMRDFRNGEEKEFSGSEAAQEHLLSELSSGDFYRMAAARDTLMKQGSSGVDAFRQRYSLLQERGFFDDKHDLSVSFARNTVNTHGATLKAKSKDFLNSFIKEQTVQDAAKAAGTWVGQNDDELSASTTSYILRGIASGGIDAKRAAAILSDDVIRNKFDREKIQILQVLKDGGNVDGKAAVQAIWDANTGKVKSRPNSERVDITDSSDDTIKISSVVVPGLAVPAAGSPVGVFSDFVDKAGSVTRLDRDDFVKLERNIRESNLPSDNDDVKKLQAAISAEINRRNQEAASINRVVGEDVYSNMTNAPWGTTDSGGGRPSPTPPPSGEDSRYDIPRDDNPTGSA